MAVRLFVGNMPYGATEADLRAHFAQVWPAVPGRHPGRPGHRPPARVRVRRVPGPRRWPKQAISRFNQQPFMGRPVGERGPAARSRRRRGGFRAGRRAGGGFGGGRPPGGGFGGPRPMGGGPGGFRSGPPAGVGRAGHATSVHRRRRATRARSAGTPRSAARRARSRNATAAGLAGCTTRRTIRRPIWSSKLPEDFDDIASTRAGRREGR